MLWPNDADGDVFRRLNATGFDFSVAHTIDYNVDFERWPPSDKALETLQSMYGTIELYPPDEDGDGYILFKVHGYVAYETVIRIQQQTTEAMAPLGGISSRANVLR